MTTKNPDKHIRKALFDMLNNIVVNTKAIKCYDMRVSQNENIDNYILLTSQSKERNKANKCEYRWDCSILIEIFCKATSNGNNGSRVLLNDIEEKVNEAIDRHLPVTCEFMTHEEAKSIVDLSKLPENASENIFAVKLTNEDALILGLKPQDIAIQIERTTHSNNRIIEFTTSLIKTEYFYYKSELSST
jgi:hypothetical protein